MIYANRGVRIAEVAVDILGADLTEAITVLH